MLDLQYNRLSQYKEFFKRNYGSDREQLVGNKTRRIVFGETEETADLQNEQLFQMQNHKMKEQDKHLVVLGHSISRQKQIAKDIGDETEIHLEILDSIDSRIQNTTINVMRGK